MQTDPWLDTVLEERYELRSLVGEGAMGRVYAAVHTRIGRRFAVKILFGDLAVQDNMRARFIREAEAASRLEHANLVSVVDFGETDGGQLFLVMEFLEGPTLEQLLQAHGALPQARVIRLGRDIMRGLRHAHERGLVHRDLKPENVVVVSDQDREVPKIVDFGVAFLATTDPDARVTRAGMVVGTPAFMAPEQALGEGIDQRADLYGFGMVMYHLLAGRGPFSGDAGEILRQAVTAPVPPIRELAPTVEVAPPLEAMILALLAKHPKDRLQSADEVLEVLESLHIDSTPTRRIPLNRAEHSTVVTPAEDEADEAPAFPVRWAAAAVLLLLLAVVLALTLVQRQRDLRGEVASDIEVEAIESTPPPEEAVAPALVAPKVPPPPPPPPVKKAAPPPPPVKKAATKPPPEPVKTAPVVAKPPPPRAPARPKVLSPEALTERYTKLGADIERVARTRGDDAAAELRERYLRIPLSAALRDDVLRETATKTLRRLERDVKKKLR